MPYPGVYNVTYNYAGWQLGQPSNPFPGVQIDADFATVDTNILNLTAFVKNVIRADGALNNGVVTFDSLSPALQTSGIASASAWATGVFFSVGAPVVQVTKLYRCL